MFNWFKRRSVSADKAVEDDWDFEEFNFDYDSEDVSDDRSPITRAASEIKKGAKDALLGTDIQAMLKRTLPSSFGEIFDTAESVQDSVSDVYRESVETLRPLKNELKMQGRRLHQALGEKLPEKVSERIAKLLEDDEYGGASAYGKENKEAAINRELASIFALQEEGAEARHQASEAKQQQRDIIGIKQHRDSLSQLDQIRQHTAQLAQYQRRVEISYQRKSLELQYRHYQVAADTLELLARQHAEFKAELAGIKKNTGLPEFVKLRGSEAFVEHMRNRFIGGVQASLFGDSERFLPNLIKTFKNRTTEFVQGAADMGELALMPVDSLVSSLDADLPGFSKERVMGQFASEYIRDWAGNKGRKFLERRSPKLVKKGNQLAVQLMNAKGHALDYLERKYHDADMFSLKGNVLGYLLDFVRESEQTADTTLQRDTLSNLSKPAVITQRFTKSVTEIIPGYLARILQEVNGIRTGKLGEIIEYDFLRNKFQDRGAAQLSIKRAISRDGGFARSLDSAGDQAVRSIEWEMEEKGYRLTSQQRVGLKRTFMALAREMNKPGSSLVVNEQTLTQAETYSQYGQMGPVDASRIATVFKNNFKKDRTGDFLRTIVSQIRNLTRSVSYSNPMYLLQELMNSGQEDILEEMGLIKDGKLDKDKAWEITTMSHADLVNESNRRGVTLDEALKPVGDARLYRPSQTAGISSGIQTQATQSDWVSQFDRLIQHQSETTQALIAAYQQTVSPQINQAILEQVSSIAAMLPQLSHIQVMATTGQLNPEESTSWYEGLWNSTKSTASSAWQSTKDGFNSAWDWTKNAPGRLGDWVSSKFDNLTGRVLKGTGKAAWWLAKAPFKATWGTAKLAWSGAKLPFKAYQKTGELLGDIYVEGDLSVRISRLDLMRGRYIDKKTGKPVHSFKDITGDVVDAEGNVVLAEQDIEKAYVSLGVGKKLVNLTGLIGYHTFSKAWAMTRSAWGIYTGSLKLGLKAAKWTLDTASEMLDAPQDVYVRGVRGPVLTKRKMARGEYWDSNTQKTIWRIKDITGEVLDLNDDIVLTEEEFKSGLLNKYGQKLGGNIRRFTNLTKRVVSRVAEGIWNTGKAATVGTARLMFGTARLMGRAARMLSRASWRGFKGFFNLNFQSADEAQVFTANATGTIVERLDKIYRLLDDRIKDSTVKGDHDGDGFADGSVLDRMKRYGKKVGSGTKTAFMTPMEELVHLFKKFMKLHHKQMDTLIDEVDENGDIALAQGWMSKLGLGGLLGGGAKGAMAKGGARGLGKGSSAVRAGHRSLGRGYSGRHGLRGVRGYGRLGNLASLAAAGYMGYNAYDAYQQGNYLESGLSGLGALAFTPGVATQLSRLPGLGFLGRGLGPAATIGFGVYDGYQSLKRGDDEGVAGAALGTVGALKGATVGASIGTAIFPGIGTAIGGLVGGVGGWFMGSTAGKYTVRLFNTLRGKDKNDFTRTRVAMYGWVGDEELLRMVNLEKILSQSVKANAQGTATVDQSSIDWKAIADLFSVDPNHSGQVKQFEAWFIQRFLPCYLGAQTALFQLKPGAMLDDLVNFDKETQVKWLESLSKIPAGHYNHMQGPMLGTQLETGQKEVLEIIQRVKAALGRAPTTTEKVLSAASWLPGGFLIKEAYQSFRRHTGLDSALREEKSTPQSGQRLLRTGAGALGVSGFTVAGGLLRQYQGSDKLDEITSMRMKSYGLKTLETDKVNQLTALEEITQPRLIYSDNRANLHTQWEDYLKEAMAIFGVVDQDKDTFSAWLQGRFLPVFLGFAGSVFAMTASKDILSALATLPVTKLMGVADAIRLAQFEGRPIWTIAFSPWVGYQLADSASVIEGNLNALKDRAKLAPLKDTVGTKPATTQSHTSHTEDRGRALLDQSKPGSALHQAVMSSIGKAGLNTTALQGAQSAATLATNRMFSHTSVDRAIPSNKRAYVDALKKELQVAGITDPKEVAAILANVDHETGGLNRLEENLNYSWSRLKQVFSGNAALRRAIQQRGEAAVEALGPQGWFSIIYGSRMGNREPGDGYKYRGRGLIQLTGRANYEAFEKATGIPVTQNPDLLVSNPEVAAKSLVWYWQRNNLGSLARNGDIRMVRRRVNGGENGMSETIGHYNKYLNGQGTLKEVMPGYAGPSAFQASDQRSDLANRLMQSQRDLVNQVQQRQPLNTAVPTASQGAGMAINAQVMQSVNYALESYRSRGGQVPTLGETGDTKPDGQSSGAPVDQNAQAVKAATLARQKAHRKSTGYCARYVANALQGAGYKFTRQGSAYMYANGQMQNMGFERIAPNSTPQTGDVMVWPAHGGPGGGGKHGHIQIFDGQNWVSDFIQRSMIPGRHYRGSTPSLWRDRRLIGKDVPVVAPEEAQIPTGYAASVEQASYQQVQRQNPWGQYSSRRDAPMEQSEPDTKVDSQGVTTKDTEPLSAWGKLANAWNLSNRPTTDVSQMRQEQAKREAEQLKPVIDVLQESLQTQKEMVSLLKQIASLQGSVVPSTHESPEASKTKSAVQPRKGNVPKTPLNMSAKPA